MKISFDKWIMAFAATCICGSMQAQTLNEAKALYNEGKYAEAKPAFEKFVKQSPGNASYNHWYGVCCLETGDIENAEKYLSVSVKRKVIDGFKYMGELYFKTFRYDKAVEMYEEYIDWLTKKKRDTEEAELRLDELENAARMMDKVEAVHVIDSIVVDKSDILQAYTLSEECGSLVYSDDMFSSSGNENSVVFVNQKGNKAYYGKQTAENHFCLFTQSLLMDKWSDEKQLPMNINSQEDDNYPFVLSDGVTIYYSSKGNGSLGGYDLFVTRYNMNTDTYLAPEQLGMPFNSPYNDYMMVIDEVKQLGWFVSDRFQPEGKACVYLFIPNENHERVNTEDASLKQAWASLSSIKTTWEAGKDYSELVALAHEVIPYGPQKKDHDFEFAVSPNTMYYKWEDFKSSEARNFYKQATDIRQQIEKTEMQLQKMRQEYSSTKNTAKKEQMKDKILQAENKLLELADQPAELEKNARNAEAPKLKRK